MAVPGDERTSIGLSEAGAARTQAAQASARTKQAIDVGSLPTFPVEI